MKESIDKLTYALKQACKKANPSSLSISKDELNQAIKLFKKK